VPVGKSSGRAVEVYLRTHGGLPPEQVPAMAATLARVLVEVGGVP
jgi:hypothetical protein